MTLKLFKMCPGDKKLFMPRKPSVLPTEVFDVGGQYLC